MEQTAAPTVETSPASQTVETPSHPDDTYVDDLALDACDDPTYEGQDYASTARGHFVYRFMTGTAAARDLDAIASAREAAYASTSAFFGLESAPTITLFLSPNRSAAEAHGYSAGYSRPASNRIDVVYTGDPGSYELDHYGHEVTHVLGAKFDDAEARVPFLDEGVAEYLDASGRDLHASYAAQLHGGAESSSSVTRLDDDDVWGQNYGRAGSFVTFLVQRHGRDPFLRLWHEAAVTWSPAWDLVSTDGITIRTGADLESALDPMLTRVYGVGFATLRAEWEAQLAPYLAAPSAAVTAGDRKEIEHVIKVIDWAIDHGDRRAYRTALEGFYCDAWLEADKQRTVATAVEGRGIVTTSIVSIDQINAKNYPQVLVQAVRHEVREGTDSTTAMQLWLEHFPVGWRVTWATAW